MGENKLTQWLTYFVEGTLMMMSNWGKSMCKSVTVAESYKIYIKSTILSVIE